MIQVVVTPKPTHQPNSIHQASHTCRKQHSNRMLAKKMLLISALLLLSLILFTRSTSASTAVIFSAVSTTNVFIDSSQEQSFQPTNLFIVRAEAALWDYFLSMPLLQAKLARRQTEQVAIPDAANDESSAESSTNNGTKNQTLDNPKTAGAGNLQLDKTVTSPSGNGSNATVGDVLTYTIKASNIGDGGVLDIEVNDAVPDYTVLYEPIVCPKNLPKQLTGCQADVEAGGKLLWRFTGALLPNEQFSVYYKVLIPE